MTFEQLRVFLEIVRSGSFTKAAARLGISQAAASAAVAALETRYKTHFLDRKNRQDQLTPAGHILLEEGEKLQAGFEAFRSRLAQLDQEHLGPLRLAASQTALRYWLPPLIETFARQHPQIELSLHEGSTTQVANAVAIGAADLGVLEQEWGESDFVVERLGTYRLVVVVGTRHPWSGRADIEWKDLPQSDWVSQQHGAAHHELFTQALAQAGLLPSEMDHIVRFPSPEAVVSAVQHGTSAAALPECAVASALATGALWRLPDVQLHGTWSALSYQGRPLAPAARAFLGFLRDTLAQEALGTHDTTAQGARTAAAAPR
ncbi:LysR family transcriptional regulator YeiE [plant metagenome]|uniref:LysR family transcriptional regulator YeiE n=1 Tax=plant metagenome TaxID=1297885 RepID=A0A484SWE7_9ZZZZ